MKYLLLALFLLSACAPKLVPPQYATNPAADMFACELASQQTMFAFGNSLFVTGMILSSIAESAQRKQLCLQAKGWKEEE